MWQRTFNFAVFYCVGCGTELKAPELNPIADCLEVSDEFSKSFNANGEMMLESSVV
jgi:hypothetical protein